MARKRKRASNPRKRKRAHARKANPRKKKRAHARKANPRRAHRRVRRAHANPPKRRRSHRRRAMANPRRRRAHARKMMSNPRRRRHSRRNPGFGFGGAILALLAGTVAFAGTIAGGYYSSDDQVARNRYIIGGVVGAVGLFALYKGKTALGMAITTGALAGAFGSLLMEKVFSVLPAKRANNVSAVFSNPMGAVYNDSLNGYEQIGAYQQIGGMGAVYSDSLQGLTPSAPWMTPTPFG